MNSLMNSIIGQQPPVTRCLVLGSLTLTVLTSLDVVSDFSMLLNWHLIVNELQLWRLITCFLFFGRFGFPFLWNTYVLVSYCSSLEEITFHRKSANFLWMLVCCVGMLLFITYALVDTYLITPGYLITPAVIDVMTYIWGRRNATTRVQVLFFTVRAPYIPWVLSAVSLLLHGHIQDHLMGIVVGHIYYFFEDVYPLLPTSKGFRLFRTPKVLKMLFNQLD